MTKIINNAPDRIVVSGIGYIKESCHAELVELVNWWDECCLVLDWVSCSYVDDPPCRHFVNGSIDDNRDESAQFLVYDAGRAITEAALRDHLKHA
jgi:hypothetical protein